MLQLRSYGTKVCISIQNFTPRLLLKDFLAFENAIPTLFIMLSVAVTVIYSLYAAV